MGRRAKGIKISSDHLRRWQLPEIWRDCAMKAPELIRCVWPGLYVTRQGATGDDVQRAWGLGQQYCYGRVAMPVASTGVYSYFGHSAIIALTPHPGRMWRGKDIGHFSISAVCIANKKKKKKNKKKTRDARPNGPVAGIPVQTATFAGLTPAILQLGDGDRGVADCPFDF